MQKEVAIKRFDNFGHMFTLDEARKDVHILIGEIYADNEIELKNRDEKIARLEEVISKMKNCHNCNCDYCLLDMKKVKECQDGGFYQWRIKNDK